MTKSEKLIQDIFVELSEFDGYSVHMLYRTYILVGYSGHNFVFKVDTGTIPNIEWNGEVHSIKSFEEAQRIILLTCLPF